MIIFSILIYVWHVCHAYLIMVYFLRLLMMCIDEPSTKITTFFMLTINLTKTQLCFSRSAMNTPLSGMYTKIFYNVKMRADIQCDLSSKQKVLYVTSVRVVHRHLGLGVMVAIHNCIISVIRKFFLSFMEFSWVTKMLWVTFCGEEELCK